MAEMRAQATATDAAGGYLVPEDWASSIESAMLAYGGIRNRATVIRTSSGNPLHMPTDNDTSNAGSILAENTQDSEQDVVFSELILNSYKYTSNIIRVSVELLQDNAFNLETFLQQKFAERLGRATAAHYATGTGTAQPNGLFTAATSGKTTATNSAITYAELIDLKHSVDPAYRGNAAWVMNDSTLAVIKKLLDGNSRPLWNPSVEMGNPGTFDGDAIVIDQGAPSIATTTTPIAYGDLSKYIIRDSSGISMTRLVERYADFHQVGFLAIMRTDGDLLDAGSNPVKVMTMAV
jgi:HK97 family phage major capsid protein